MNKNINDLLKIPNFFTFLNILCGVSSIFFAIENNYSISGILILLGMLFDFLDGYAARLLNQQSELGKQLDSFADMITFGLAPSILVYTYKYHNINIILKISLIVFILSIIYRLAKYNLNFERQKDIFSGLPSTFSGSFIAFLILWFPIIFNFKYSFLIFILLAMLSVSVIPYKKIRFHNIYHVIILIILIFLYLIFKKYLILSLFIIYIFSGFLNIIFDLIKKRNSRIHLKIFNYK